MGAKDKRIKPPVVKDAEITKDGCLIVDLGVKVFPNTTKALFTPEALLSLVQEYGEILPADESDYPGIPVVEEEAIFADDEDDEEGDGDDEGDDGGEGPKDPPEKIVDVKDGDVKVK